MSDRRRLRLVGADERAEDVGSWAIVLEDLGVAKGHVTEAAAEIAHCPGNKAALGSVLATLLAALDECIRQADNARKELT